MKFCSRAAILAACGAAGLTAAGASAQEAEVIHWWTSGSESEAIGVFVDAFEERGGTWVDSAVVSGDAAQGLALSRILGGDPPTAMQWNIGIDILNLAQQGVLNDIDEVAVREGWADVLPPIVVERATYEGQFVAAPVNIHGANWMWYSPAVFEEAGAEVPQTWDEFFAAADKIREAGFIPLALGGQPWQEQLLFGAVLAGVGGNDLYRRVYEDRDPEAASSPEMLAVLETMGRLRAYVDEGSPGRNWNDATNLVLTGQAGMQIMGDWAKGEFEAAGMTAGEDFGCAMAPGNEDSYILVVDVFAFPKTDDPAQIEAQHILADVMLDPEVQVRFNEVKGSVPVRQDVSLEGMDICSQQAMEILADPAHHLPNPALALSGDLEGALNDVLTQFWNTPDMPAEEAAAMLADAISSL